MLANAVFTLELLQGIEAFLSQGIDYAVAADSIDIAKDFRGLSGGTD